jgi:nucleoside 2-deoxyribosyltransferase
MPRFYLATRKDRSEQANALQRELEARGWQRTFIWQALDEKSTNGYAEAAVAELKGVHDADVLIVLLPGGFGTHVEIGAALALGKPVILHAPDAATLASPYPCIFHHHPGVKRIVSRELDADAIVGLLPA